MADYYKVHYRIAYKRFSGGTTTIDILEKDYWNDSDLDASSQGEPPIVNLEAAENPLEISVEGNPENLYESPTIGSGAVIKVMAQPLTLKNLFTTDPQKFMVKIYDGATGENLHWQGFINTGIYSESYSTPSVLTHEICIYCNNGMKILEDIPYTQTLGGAKYTGLATIGAVMDNILAKINLTFTKVLTNHTLTYGTGIYADTTSLFVNLKVNNENFYDESGEAKSCRDVMNSIFAPFGWICSFKGPNIVFLDPLDLPVMYAHSYDVSPLFGANEQNSGWGLPLDISNGDISWGKTGSQSDIVMPYNKIDLTYDPYCFTESGYDFNGEGNGTQGDVSSEITNNDVTYTLWTAATMKDWTLNGTLCNFIALKQTNPTDENQEFFIRMMADASASNTFEYTFPDSGIKQDDNLMLELTMTVLVNTRHASNIFDPAEVSTVISSIYLYGFGLQIGDKYFNHPHGGAQQWNTTSSNTFEIYVRETDAKIEPGYYIHKTWFRRRRYVPEFDTSEIQDKRVTAICYIPLGSAYVSGGLLSGDVTIRIPEKLTANALTGVVNVLISDVNIAIVNTKKVPISNDGVKATGTITDAICMKKSVLSVALTTGIGPNGAAKGAISSDLQVTNPGTNITGLKRLLDGSFYTMNQLLLQTLLSQHGSPRSIIRGTLDVKDFISDYTGLGPYYNLILDSSHLVNDDSSTKKYLILSSTYHDREETLDVSMVEVANAREAIV